MWVSALLENLILFSECKEKEVLEVYIYLERVNTFRNRSSIA